MMLNCNTVACPQRHACRDVSEAKDFVTFVTVSFDKLAGAEFDVLQLRIPCGAFIFFQGQKVTFCASFQLESHLTLSGLLTNAHCDHRTRVSANLAYSEHFLWHFYIIYLRLG